MSPYAIIQASGRQFWIEESRFYDFDKLPFKVGDTFKLNRVLLLHQHGSCQIGKPFLDKSCLIETVVIRHHSGPKIRVYKMRPKKKTRKTFGSRPKLTRVLIRSITPVKTTVPVCYL